MFILKNLARKGLSNIDSRNSLWTQQTISWTNFDFSSEAAYYGIHLRPISQKVLKMLIH